MIRILIVDDHPVVRDGIRAILSTEADFEVVGEAGDGREAIAAFKAHAPDVVLMDLKMPRMDGPDAIAAILRSSSVARIVVLTTYDGDEEIHRALEGEVGQTVRLTLVRGERVLRVTLTRTAAPQKQPNSAGSAAR